MNKEVSLYACLLVLSLSLMGCSSQTTTVVPTTKFTAAKPVTESVAKKWQEVIEFKGSSIKTTQKFKVDSNNWRIKWSTTPGTMGNMNFQIYVTDASGTNVNDAANIVGKGNNESYISTAGEYSLTINTAQNYDIVIEQNK
jgi:hypothetical protein